MLKNELRGLVGLVDAVRSVDTSSIKTEEAIQATIWPRDESLRLHDDDPDQSKRPIDELQYDGTGTLPREQLLVLARRKLRNAFVVHREARVKKTT